MSQQEEYISKLSLYLFWDIDITKADMDTCPAQIIQHVLEYGQWEDWQLIRSYLWIGQNRINMQVITHP